MLSRFDKAFLKENAMVCIQAFGVQQSPVFDSNFITREDRPYHARENRAIFQ